MRAFAQADRFVSEVQARKLRPAYVFVGDEVFFRKRCREAILEHLVPADLRDFSLFEFDLADTDLAEVLDRARTPSLMAPFQVFFIRGVKNLFGRGSNEEKLAAIEAYCKDPNPDAVLIFVADHISIPADARRMEMTDKDRYERIRESMGELLRHRRTVAGGGKRSRPLDRRILPDSKRKDRRRRLPRVSRCPRRRYDDGLKRNRKADALRGREETHHAGRRRNHGASRQAAVVI